MVHRLSALFLAVAFVCGSLFAASTDVTMGGSGGTIAVDSTQHQATLLRPGGRITNTGASTCYVNVAAATVVTDGTAHANLFIMPVGNSVILPNCYFFTFATASGSTTLNFEALSSSQSAVTNIDASHITAGTLNDARLSPNVSTMSGANVWTSPNNVFSTQSGTPANLTVTTVTGQATITLGDTGGRDTWQVGRDITMGNTFEIRDVSNGGTYFYISRDGHVVINGPVLTTPTLQLAETSAPAAPTTGVTFYVDSADHKLKVIGSSGTVTSLANP